MIHLVRVGAALAVLAALAGCAGTGGGSAPAAESSPMATATSRNVDTPERRRAEIRIELAAQYFQAGQAAVALDQVSQALQADPTYPDAHNLLALIYMELRENARAEAAFQQALRLAPRDPDILNNYGWFLCQTDRIDAALAQFAQALANPLYAQPAKSLNNSGICELRRGRDEPAKAFFQQAFRQDPTSAVAMLNLAELHLKRNELEQAGFYAERLFQVNGASPESAWLVLRVARLRGQTNRMSEMSQLLRSQFPASREAGLLGRGQYEP